MRGLFPILIDNLTCYIRAGPGSRSLILTGHEPHPLNYAITPFGLRSLTINNPGPASIKLPLSQSSTPTRISPSHEISFFDLINPLCPALFGIIWEIQFLMWRVGEV